MSAESSETALKDLKSLLVDIHLGRQMKSYADNLLTFDDGSTLYSEMVIRTAGVTGRPLEFEGTDFRQGTRRALSHRPFLPCDRP